jgi:hypothetical protein
MEEESSQSGSGRGRIELQRLPGRRSCWRGTGHRGRKNPFSLLIGAGTVIVWRRNVGAWFFRDRLYNDRWGTGHFTVNGGGNVQVMPTQAYGQAIDLMDVISEARDRGMAFLPRRFQFLGTGSETLVPHRPSPNGFQNVYKGFSHQVNRSGKSSKIWMGS